MQAAAEMFLKLGIGGEFALNQPLDQADPATWGFCLVTKQTVGWALGQTEATLDAEVGTLQEFGIVQWCGRLEKPGQCINSGGSQVRTMSYYRYHLFVCGNQREDGSPCCGDFHADRSRAYLKQRCKELGIHQPGGIRINKAGCMGRCQQGPVIVVYPEAVWYTYIDETDLEEIFRSHLLAGKVVDRLRLSPEP